MNESKSAKAKVAAAVICITLVLCIIPSAIYGIVYCAKNDVSVKDMITSMNVSKEEMLVGKWQDESGASAYEFFEDGSYDSYISTFSYSGRYQVDGDEIKLVNPDAAGVVVYKFKVTNDTLELTLAQEYGLDAEDEKASKFIRVERIDTKSPKELFNSITEELADAYQESADNQEADAE